MDMLFDYVNTYVGCLREHTYADWLKSNNYCLELNYKKTAQVNVTKYCIHTSLTLGNRFIRKETLLLAQKCKIILTCLF